MTQATRHIVVVVVRVGLLLLKYPSVQREGRGGRRGNIELLVGINVTDCKAVGQGLLKANLGQGKLRQTVVVKEMQIGRVADGGVCARHGHVRKTVAKNVSPS